MMLELNQKIKDIDRWVSTNPGAVAAIMQGEDNVFCAGLDVSTPGFINSKENGKNMCDIMHENMTRWKSLPLLSFAAVEGFAFGGGAELAFASDFRVIASNAKLRFVQTKMGLSCGWQGVKNLKELVGRHKALKILISGNTYSGKECLEMGLTDGNELPNMTVFETTMKLIENMTQDGYPAAIRGIKAAIHGAEGMDDLVNEKEIFVKLWGEPDMVEAMSGFKNRKKSP